MTKILQLLFLFKDFLIIIDLPLSVPPQLTYLSCAASMIYLKFSKSFKILFMYP